MKTERMVLILLAGGLLAGACTTVLAQAEQVKIRAKELKKQVEKGNTTNAPAKPKPAK